MADRPHIKRHGYDLIRALSRIAAVLIFRIRCHGRQHIPATGAVLVCANHQSMLDPVLIGLAFDRRMNYLARQTLFRFAPFRWLIEFLDAIPIDREGLGLSGLRECLRRLKRGEIVLIFPEGTRTNDGTVLPLRSGFCALARRNNVTVLPIGLDGAFDAWPRWARLPRPSPIHVCISQPLPPEEIRQLDDEQLVATVEQRIRACHFTARAGVRVDGRASKLCSDPMSRIDGQGRLF
jgi:1-acyl-sn-glycerol-3-phosphate acyltransferase